METLIEVLYPTLALIIAALVGFALRKAGVSPELAVKATEVTRAAIMSTEEYAKRSGIKGPEKLQLTLEKIDMIATPEIKAALKGKSTQFVEYVLRSTVVPVEVSPK